MLQKIREFLKEKGQGTVEYGLIIGFVAIIAVWMLTGSGLKDDVKTNVTNADTVSKNLQSEFNAASNSSGGGGSTSSST